MNHQGAIDYILARLQQELPAHLLYHGHHHTLDVLEATERIAMHQQVTSHELNLLLVAAAYHDCGFLTTYANHELAGCAIAQEQLPAFGFNTQDIEAICAMIMATKVPQDPKSRLADILCDADLDYLGRDDFFAIGTNLYLELNHLGVLKDEESWNRLQVKFLSSHKYHTTYGQTNRETEKCAHLATVEKLVATYKD
jgi:hypothetical protein